MITKLTEILQGWSTHDDEDMSRMKLGRIRPRSGRKVVRIAWSGYPNLKTFLYIYIYIYTSFIQSGRPDWSSVRMSIFRPLPGRIWSSFLLEISRSSCVDHPCKISVNLVIVKALKIDLVYRRSESVRNWHTTEKQSLRALTITKLAEILQRWSIHDDLDMFRRKLDQIRPESGRKMQIRTWTVFLRTSFSDPEHFCPKEDISNIIIKYKSAIINSFQLIIC